MRFIFFVNYIDVFNFFLNWLDVLYFWLNCVKKKKKSCKTPQNAD